MAINDILSSLLEKTGIKKSNVRKCEDAIAELEGRIRDLHDELEGKGEEIKLLESRLRTLKERYDASSPAAKKLLDAQIRSLISDYKRMEEMQGLILRNIEKHKALLAAKNMELETLRHPVDAGVVDDAIDTKQEIVDDLKDEDKSLDKLSETTYEKEEEATARLVVRDEAADKARDEALERDLEALLGKQEEIPEAKRPEVSEPEPEIA